MWGVLVEVSGLLRTVGLTASWSKTRKTKESAELNRAVKRLSDEPEALKSGDIIVSLFVFSQIESCVVLKHQNYFVSKLENWNTNDQSFPAAAKNGRHWSWIIISKQTVFEFYNASCGIMWRLNYQIYVWFCISIYWRIEPTVSQGLSFCHYYYNCNTFRYFWFISWWSVC